MTSSRLPGKHLMEVLGRPILSYLLDRLKTVESIDSIIITTTENSTDDVLVEFTKQNKVEIYRGDEDDVMGRVLDAAKYFKADIICEVTGDCPIIDPQLVEQVIQTYLYNNVAYGPKINGIKNKAVLKEIVIQSLKKAAIYEQVKDNLGDIATGLSGGQQQRLCIARAIANYPKILLMDEPTSALDPIAASKVEDLILELKKDYTIIMVTHSMQQAARISDRTAFFYEGELIEYGTTKQLFKQPKEKRTDDYIRGKFG